MDLKSHIRQIPDFPKPGILFYDISTLLRNGPAWAATVDRLTDIVRAHKPDMLVGIESRGFLVVAPVAYALGCGFAMVRKKEKLPGETLAYTYALEYGTDTIEIQADAAETAQAGRGRGRGGLHHRARLPARARPCRRAVRRLGFLRRIGCGGPLQTAQNHRKIKG